MTMTATLKEGPRDAAIMPRYCAGAGGSTYGQHVVCLHPCTAGSWHCADCTKHLLNSWNAAPPRASGFGQRRQGISLSNAYQEAAAKQRPKHSPSARGRRALNFESYIFSIMLLGGKAGCQDSFEVFLAAGVRPQPKAFGTGTWCFDVGHSAEIIRAGISREAA